VSDVKTCPTCGSEYPLSERFCPRDGTALRSSNAQGDLLGTVVAERYHVIKKLGAGGMGTVYLAEHVKMGRKSALKVMNPGMNQDPDAVARFNREASNASRLNHPNICAIYDFGETPDGLIYLAMEFIEGEPLTDLIEKAGALPPARAATILHQSADALAVAHDYGIVHRDLKPDNIMVSKGRDGSDQAKVVDFGIAKASSSDAQKVTKTGLVVGTPEYMSPEQLAGDTLDGRSDIYSLALVGFNMLTGTLPFPSKSAQEAMIMRLTDHPRRLDEMRPEVAWPEALQTVMDKALARDPDERYRSAAEFGRDFANAIAAMPATQVAEAATQVIGAATVAVGAAAVPKTRVAGAAAAPPAPAASATPAAAGAGSNKGMLVGGIGAVVAAVAIGAFMMKGGSDPATTPGTEPPAVAQQTAPAEPPTSAPAQPLSRPAGGTNPPPAERRTDATPPPANTGGSTTTSPNAAALARLDRLSDPTGTPAEWRQAINEATALLPGLTGEERAEVLFRRGAAKINLEDDSGCEDVASARRLLDSGSVLWRAVNNILAACGIS